MNGNEVVDHEVTYSPANVCLAICLFVCIGSEAIARIMACDPEDAYAVLGVGDNASDEDIKKYYRKQCVMVHPDKVSTHKNNKSFIYFIYYFICQLIRMFLTQHH